ncbi:hypothetical protein DYY67_0578 [Candidatus Nitrosotalea sp. TS]|uniref:hypothetical protein n=1 Tax=Candidatus Nitrosotalea sp. TS TaxID=2341020 RepID=UPI00140CFBFC|nr:hypothetical protein [Candidatus Nitrosotalea sp. TS]NHI02539.1 hypothetical protein [Candidatus Nitrosotalea sp. TS]
MNLREAEAVIRETLDQIKKHEIELHQGCVACHVIFSITQKSGRSEQDAADLMSQVSDRRPRIEFRAHRDCRADTHDREKHGRRICSPRARVKGQLP